MTQHVLFYIRLEFVLELVHLQLIFGLRVKTINQLRDIKCHTLFNNWYLYSVHFELAWYWCHLTCHQFLDSSNQYSQYCILLWWHMLVIVATVDIFLIFRPKLPPMGVVKHTPTISRQWGVLKLFKKRTRKLILSAFECMFLIFFQMRHQWEMDIEITDP